MYMCVCVYPYIHILVYIHIFTSNSGQRYYRRKRVFCIATFDLQVSRLLLHRNWICLQKGWVFLRRELDQSNPQTSLLPFSHPSSSYLNHSLAFSCIFFIAFFRSLAFTRMLSFSLPVSCYFSFSCLRLLSLSLAIALALSRSLLHARALSLLFSCSLSLAPACSSRPTKQPTTSWWSVPEFKSVDFLSLSLTLVLFFAFSLSPVSRSDSLALVFVYSLSVFLSRSLPLLCFSNFLRVCSPSSVLSLSLFLLR